MLINVGGEFGTHLESNEIAMELVDILNKIDGDDFILDFKEVIFVNMNFDQAYYNAKKKYKKKISEINISDEISVVMGAADEACNP